MSSASRPIVPYLIELLSDDFAAQYIICLSFTFSLRCEG